MGPEPRGPDALSTEEFARWWKETGERELRQILFWKWDPIGVSDLFPNSADEYDGYAPQVVRALRSGAGDQEIAGLLLTIEHDAMGPGQPSAERRREVAELLVTWFENSQDSWRDFGPLRP